MAKNSTRAGSGGATAVVMGEIGWLGGSEGVFDN